MAELATRGNLASSLYAALGISSPTSSGTFGDSGPLDGITSTLADLGITKGVGAGQYGTAQNTTRGQAFTMIARALGLADGNTSIEEASQALVNAGVVKGYGDNPNNLGLGEVLEVGHLEKLMGRIAPILTAAGADGGPSISETLLGKADEMRDEDRAETDPAYAAFLAKQGIKTGSIDDEIALRTDLFNEDALRRSETYQRATEASIDGVQTDFENRGLFRSGTRMQREADKTQEIGYRQEADNYTAQRAYEEEQRRLEQQKQGYLDEETDYKMNYEANKAQTEIEDGYA